MRHESRREGGVGLGLGQIFWSFVYCFPSCPSHPPPGKGRNMGRFWADSILLSRPAACFKHWLKKQTKKVLKKAGEFNKKNEKQIGHG